MLNRLEFFTVKAGERVTKEIILRPLVPRDADLGSLPRLPEGFEIMDGVELSEYAGHTGCILAFLGPHREPAKHLVKEMLQLSDAFRKWGGMSFIVTTDISNRELNRLPNTDIVGIAAGVQDPAEKALAHSSSTNTNTPSWQWSIAAAAFSSTATATASASPNNS